MCQQKRSQPEVEKLNSNTDSAEKELLTLVLRVAGPPRAQSPRLRAAILSRTLF